MSLSRRALLGTLASASAAVAAEKIADGGLAEVTPQGVPDRRSPDGSPAPVLPAGAGSYDRFASKCVGCGLCVSACPENVLRKGTLRTGFRPHMDFDRGWCRPDCTLCGQACPTGAIARLTPSEKKDTHVGTAVWNLQACLAAREGVSCHACERHCPTKAIALVNGLPVVDAEKCVGCGACETYCPSRPLPAIWVRGLSRHRLVRPTDDSDARAEAVRLVTCGEAACVVIRDGVIVAREQGRGIRPLLAIYDGQPGCLRGATVVDKVIGRAAAAILTLGGAARVRALTVEEDARSFLVAHRIACTADHTVPQILNADKTAPCPMEAAVAGRDDPAEMLAALRARLATR